MLIKSIHFIIIVIHIPNDNYSLSISIGIIEYNYSIHFLYNSNSTLKLIHVTSI